MTEPQNEPQEEAPVAPVHFYSATTKGFYVSTVHADYMPEDAVEITEETYLALLDAQATGKRISSASDGTPNRTASVPMILPSQVACC